MLFRNFYLLERDDLGTISKANGIIDKFEKALLSHWDIFLTNFLEDHETNLDKIKSVTIPFDRPLEKLRLVFPKVTSGELKSASYSPASPKNNLTPTIRVYSKGYRDLLDKTLEVYDRGEKIAMSGLVRSIKAYIPKLLQNSSLVHEIVHALDDTKFGITKATPDAKKVMELQKTLKEIPDIELQRSLESKLHKIYINQTSEYNAEFLQSLNDILKDFIAKKISLEYLQDYKNLEKEFWKHFIASKDSVTADNVKRIQKRLYSFFEVLKSI